LIFSILDFTPCSCILNKSVKVIFIVEFLNNNETPNFLQNISSSFKVIFGKTEVRYNILNSSSISCLCPIYLFEDKVEIKFMLNDKFIPLLNRSTQEAAAEESNNLNKIYFNYISNTGGKSISSIEANNDKSEKLTIEKDRRIFQITSK